MVGTLIGMLIGELIGWLICVLSADCYDPLIGVLIGARLVDTHVWFDYW